MIVLFFSCFLLCLNLYYKPCKKCHKFSLLFSINEHTNIHNKTRERKFELHAHKVPKLFFPRKVERYVTPYRKVVVNMPPAQIFFSLCFMHIYLYNNKQQLWDYVSWNHGIGRIRYNIDQFHV